MPNRCLQRLVTNLALMTQPAAPTRRYRVCFFFRVLLKSEKSLIAKTFYPLPSPFHFQAFFVAITFETSEPLATPYLLKSDRWPSAKWKHLNAPFSRFKFFNTLTGKTIVIVQLEGPVVVLGRYHLKRLNLLTYRFCRRFRQHNLDT